VRSSGAPDHTTRTPGGDSATNWADLTGIRVPNGVDAGAFTFVMATGIVSIAAATEGLAILSDTLLACAIAGWFALAWAVFPRAVRTIARPRLQSFALVAGTAVIGARFALAGEQTVALALWSLALLFYILLVAGRPAIAAPVGSSLLFVVATESLALLAALLAPSTVGLLDFGLATWAFGLCLYPLLAAAIVLRLRRPPRFAPDLWIVMGALAIATLAGADLLLAARALQALHVLDRLLPDVDLATWSLASCLIIPLVAAEVQNRGEWRNGPSRWSFVFPLGMYAVATKTLAQADTLPPLSRAGTVFFAVAVAAWVVVLVGCGARVVPTLPRSPARPRGLGRRSFRSSGHLPADMGLRPADCVDCERKPDEEWTGAGVGS